MSLLYYYRALFRPAAQYVAPKRAAKKVYRVSYERRTAVAEPEDLRPYAQALVSHAKIRQKQKEEDNFIISNVLAGV